MTIRRLKTYTGAQGYVYQYYFVGTQRVGNRATEYVFDVTADRKLTYPVTVTFSLKVLTAWADGHGRLLSDSEQYAAVKMRLFRAFDEIEDMQQNGKNVEIDLPALEQSLEALGIQ